MLAGLSLELDNPDEEEAGKTPRTTISSYPTSFLDTSGALLPGYASAGERQATSCMCRRWHIPRPRFGVIKTDSRHAYARHVYLVSASLVHLQAILVVFEPNAEA